MVRQEYKTIILTSPNGNELEPWMVSDWDLEVESLEFGKKVIDSVIKSLDTGEK